MGIGGVGGAVVEGCGVGGAVVEDCGCWMVEVTIATPVGTGGELATKIVVIKIAVISPCSVLEGLTTMAVLIVPCTIPMVVEKALGLGTSAVEKSPELPELPSSPEPD